MGEGELSDEVTKGVVEQINRVLSVNLAHLAPHLYNTEVGSLVDCRVSMEYNSYLNPMFRSFLNKLAHLFFDCLTSNPFLYVARVFWLRLILFLNQLYCCSFIFAPVI